MLKWWPVAWSGAFTRRNGRVFHEGGCLRLDHGLTKGRGPDACIDTVGTEAAPIAQIGCSTGRRRRLSWGRIVRMSCVRRFHCCRNFGTVSIVGVDGGFLESYGFRHQSGTDVPDGADACPALPAKAVRAYRERRHRSLLRHHPHGPARKGPELYKTFRDKEDAASRLS
jgi:threonine dehydrogenase-like Zn-dependent dehydrogenase